MVHLLRYGRRFELRNTKERNIKTQTERETQTPHSSSRPARLLLSF